METKEIVFQLMLYFYVKYFFKSISHFVAVAIITTSDLGRTPALVSGAVVTLL